MTAMLDHLIAKPGGPSAEIIALAADTLDGWLDGADGDEAAWVRANGFTAKPGAHCLLPGDGGRIAKVLLGIESSRDPWAYGGLPVALPEGDYHLARGLDADQANDAALGWALGGYRFTRYREATDALARLVWPGPCDRDRIENLAAAVTLTRDLINTPAEDMGPEALAAVAADLAENHGGACAVTVGDDLLAAGYPLIHAVGRAAAQAPRLIDLTWGDPAAPRLTLVGKGVCFDSGGLDLKSAGGMMLMKKDMGGAAHVLGLARAIMGAGLPLRLRVLVPAVENSVAGNAIRPLDIVKSRKGLTVEIGNTDALAADILRNAAATVDPLWRLPLWAPYRELLDSKTADINNTSSGTLGGAITAALFLSEFVTETPAWAHIDMMAWNATARPGRPVGGEAMCLRALFALIEERFC